MYVCICTYICMDICIYIYIYISGYDVIYMIYVYIAWGTYAYVYVSVVDMFHLDSLLRSRCCGRHKWWASCQANKVEDLRDEEVLQERNRWGMTHERWSWFVSGYQAHIYTLYIHTSLSLSHVYIYIYIHIHTYIL